MKNIFASLLGKPQADKASVALGWLDDLDQIDDVAALQKSTHQLTSFAGADLLTSVEHFRAILIIDQKNRNRINKVTTQFTSFDSLRPELSARITETAYFYHRQLYASYRNLINNFINSPNNKVLNEKQLPLILGRAMLAIYAMMKWRFYSNQLAADNAWLELFSLYKIAEDESIIAATIQLYQDEDEVNLGKTFILICMLGTLDHASMSKQQTELAAQLLEKWTSATKPSLGYLEQRHLYYIDLSKDHPAKRIRHFQPTPSCRYWDIDQLASKIKLAIASVEDKQPLEYLDLGNLMLNDQLLEVLLMMRAEWSRVEYRRQRRSEEREKVIKSVSVTYGIEDICTRIKSLGLNPAGRPTDNYSLDDRLMNARSIVRGGPNVLFSEVTKEHWMINDESASGFGILVSQELNAQTKIGKLVGLVIDNNKHEMVVGTIRSVKKLANGHHHVGVKILAKQAKVVQLRVSVNNVEKNAFGAADSVATTPLAFFSGLYIAVEPGITIWPSLLLPRLNFQQNKLYEIMHADKKVIVQLGVSTEARDDWAKVSWPD